MPFDFFKYDYISINNFDGALHYPFVFDFKGINALLGAHTVDVLLSGVSPLTLLNAVSLNYVKAFGKCEQRNLPKGYKQLEYIIFDSTQVLDTGFTPNNNSRIESECYRTGTNCWFYGASPNNPRVTLYHSNDGTSRWGNQSRNSFGFSANTKYTLIQDKNGLNINGVNYPWDTGSAGDFTCDRSLTIGNDNGSTGTRYFAGNFYYMKIYDNDVLVRDYVPVKRISDNSLGIYDRVNDTFLTASGFTAGAEVTPSPDNVIPIWCNNGAIKVKDDELPVGYKRLLDISTTGNVRYISNVYLTGEDTLKFIFKATAGNLIGAYNDADANDNFSFYNSTNATASYARYNGQTGGSSTYTGTTYTVIISPTGITGIRNPSSFTPTEFTCSIPLCVFATSPTGSVHSNATIYGSIEVTGSQNLNLVPCERISDGAIGYYETHNGEFLENQESGTPTTSGYDTSHLTEIYIDGTVEVVTVKQAFVNDSDIVDRTGLNSSNGSAISNNSRCYVLFPCKAGVTYTAQTDTADLIGGNFIEYRQPSATSANFIKSITATDDGLVGGVYQFHAVCDTDGWAGWQCKANKATAMANNWQITADTSSATCQPLLSVGDYKDVQNITNGAITRNIGIYLLDGTENWQAVGTSYADGSKRYYFNDDGYSKYADTGELCTHFVQSPLANRDAANQTGHFFANQNSFHIRISSSLANDVSALKSWLKGQFDAGHPVMFTYPLDTPTTETVTGQTLTITQGTNVVTAEGSVDDLELEVSYKAYAEVTVEEIEAVNTDENVEVTIS